MRTRPSLIRRSGESGRILSHFGIFTTLAGALLLAVAFRAGSAMPVAASHEPELDIVKNAAGLHSGGPNDQQREWTLREIGRAHV